MIEIREATEGDLPAIIRLLWNDEQGRHRESLAQKDWPPYLEAFKAVQTDPNALLLVAHEDETVCGCLQLNILSGLSFQGMKRGLIEDVRVQEAFRQKGIGRKLISTAEKIALERGCGLLELFVHEDRPLAHSFYEACGFEGKHRGFRRRLNST